MVSTANLIYLLIIALAAITLPHYKAITGWYAKQTERLQTLLFVLGVFILISVLMNFK